MGVWFHRDHRRTEEDSGGSPVSQSRPRKHQTIVFTNVANEINYLKVTQNYKSKHWIWEYLKTDVIHFNYILDSYNYYNSNRLKRLKKTCSS